LAERHGTRDVPVLVLELTGADAGALRLHERGGIDDLEPARELEVAADHREERVGVCIARRHRGRERERHFLSSRGADVDVERLLGLARKREQQQSEERRDEEERERSHRGPVSHCLSFAASVITTPFAAESTYSAGGGAGVARFWVGR